MGRGLDRWLMGKSMAEAREALRRRLSMQAEAMKRSLEAKSGLSMEAAARRREAELRRNWELALLADVGAGRAVPKDAMASDWGRRLRTKEGMDLLGEAIIQGRIDLMDDLCSVFDARALRGSGLTSWMVAARHGKREMIIRLLEMGLGLNLDDLDEKGRSASFHAAEAGNACGLMAILESGGKIAPDALGRSAASAAAEAGCVESLSVLARYGVDVLARDSTGFTPFIAACAQGRLHAAQWLLGMGANPFDEGPAGQAVIDMVGALARGGDPKRREVMGWLAALAEGAQISASSGSNESDGSGAKRL